MYEVALHFGMSIVLLPAEQALHAVGATITSMETVRGTYSPK